MIKAKKYTFLLPAFKAKFLEEALNSIKAQEYKEFICLVSDDCSPDDIRSIFYKVVGDDPRFEYRRNEVNMGSKSLVSHWNLLVDMCDTEYLIMASDDDVYEPEFLLQIDALTKRYPDVNVLRAKARRLEDGIVAGEDDDIPEFLTHEDFMEYFGNKPMILCLANYVFNTSALKDMGGFPDFPTAAKSDSATAIYLSKNAIATTKDILFSFRMSRENLSSVEEYARNSIRVCTANLMFADWYKEQFGTIYPHKRFVEDIAFYVMARMPLNDCIHFAMEFRKRGYFKGFKPILTMSKNWIKLHR